MYEALGFVPTTGSQHLSGRAAWSRVPAYPQWHGEFEVTMNRLHETCLEKENKAIHKKIRTQSEISWSRHMATAQRGVGHYDGAQGKDSKSASSGRRGEDESVWQGEKNLTSVITETWWDERRDRGYEALTESLMYSFKDMKPIKDNNHLFN